MGFLFALLSYFAVIATAVVTIVMSVAFIFPGPVPAHKAEKAEVAREATDVSARKSGKPKRLSMREITRQLADRAATRR